MKSKKLINVLAFFVFFLAFSIFSMSFAETILLKTGASVEGNIVSQTDEYIKLDRYGIVLTYYHDEIESIDTNSGDIPDSLPSDNKDPDDMWTRFDADENKAPLINIINMLFLPETDENEPLISSATKSLLKNIPLHVGALKTFKEEYKKADEEQKQRMESLSSAMEIINRSASNHNRKGLNYYKAGIYNAALEEYNIALEIYPAYYPVVYTNIANVYEGMGNMDKAFQYAKKVFDVNPKSRINAYNLARHYFMRGKPLEAIPLYKIALEYKPKEPAYLHGLASSYEDLGDVKNSVKYFKQYLEYAPHGESAEEIKEYLASVGFQANAQEPDIVTLLQNRQFDELEKQLSTLLEKKEKNEDGAGILYNAYNELTDTYHAAEYNPEQWLGYFSDWIEHDSSSHFANACLGIFYIHYAWQARGTGWATTVTEEGGDFFTKRLELAREHLERAFELDPSDAAVAVRLITVAIGLGLEFEEMEKQFQRAILADPTSYEAYAQKLEYLKAKWHGSSQLMFAFARKSAAEAPPNSSIPGILAKAHWQQGFVDKKHFRIQENWNETQDAYMKVLEAFPDSNETQNWLAKLAYYARDYDVAKQAFQRVGDNWSSDCWGNFKRFKKIKEKVFNDNKD